MVLEALECLNRSTCLILLYLRNIPVKFGKNPVRIVSEEKFCKEKVYKHTHACTLLSLNKSIINKIIEEIHIHRFNLPKF